MVQDAVAAHFGGEGDLIPTHVERLKKAGKSLEGLTTLDLASVDEMQSLLTQAGFKLIHVHDSTEEGEAWFKEMAKRLAQVGPPPVSFQVVLGDDFPEMAGNQVGNLAERRIRTVTYICEA